MKHCFVGRFLLMLAFIMASGQKASCQYIMSYPEVFFGYYSGSILNPSAMAIDNKGGIFVAVNDDLSFSITNYYVLKYNAANILNPWQLFAGNDSMVRDYYLEDWRVYSGDGGPATAAVLGNISCMAADSKGNVYLLDNSDLRVRKVDTNGIITTYAGGGSSIYAIDGVAATTALLNNPSAIACDKWGNLYIAQSGDNRIRKVDTNGLIHTIAGTGIYGYSGDGGAATAADLQVGGVMAVDTAGNVYLGGTNIRKIGTDGHISSIAGNGLPGYSGDGGPATNAAILASAISADLAGNLYLMQTVDDPAFYYGYAALRKIDTGGTITTIASMDHAGSYALYYNSLCEYRLNQTHVDPFGVMQSDTAGNLYYLNYQVLKISLHATEPVSYYSFSQSLNVCGSGPTSLGAYLAAYDTVGVMVHWSVAVAPAHGVLVCADSLPVADSLLTPAGITYTPASGFTGADTIVISISNGIAVVFDTIRLTVYQPDTIIGDSLICADEIFHNYYLSFPGSGGWWNWSSLYCFGVTDSSAEISSYFPTIGTISYTNVCGTTTKTITVVAAPAITGSALVCPGDTILLSASEPGGVWSASGGHAAISPGGIVTGISTGMGSVSYSLAGCTIEKQVQVGVIDVLPADTMICLGAVFSDYAYGTSGEFWTSSNPSSVRIVSGYYLEFDDTGVAIVTATNACGSATNSITVNPFSGVITIAGLDTLIDAYSSYDIYHVLCDGATYSATETVPGGIWSVSGGHMAIDSVGNIDSLHYSGFSSDVITYTVGGCSSTLLVNVISSNISMVCDSTSCAGSNFGVVVLDSSDFHIFNLLYGGGWSLSAFMWQFRCSDPLINPYDISTADPFEQYFSCRNVTAGVVTFTYNSGCASVSRTVTINPQPDAPDVPYDICMGSTITATDATPGGTWSATYGNVSVDSTGVVSAVHESWDLIIYTLPTGCYNTAPVYVSTVSPAPIMGNHTFCAGEYLNLTDSTPHGVWSSSDPAVVNNELIAVGAGTAVITYNNGCGQVTRSVTVFPSPEPIFGEVSMCRSSIATFTDSSTGGTWSVTGPGSISTTGVYTPSGAGNALINYTFPTGCVYSHAVQIDAPPSITFTGMSGDSVFCGLGVHTGIIDSAGGGYWSSSNYDVASYLWWDGYPAELRFYSISPGITTLTHSVTNACGSFVDHKQIKVYPPPGNTFFHDDVCAGTGWNIYEADSTGIWHNYSSHASLTTSPTLTDEITGVSGGVDTITYTDSNICGLSTQYYITTVYPILVISPIAGPSSICFGSTATYTDTTGYGRWGVSGSGEIFGGLFHPVTAGVEVIYYTAYSAGYCSATATKTVTVQPLTETLTDSIRICEGTDTTLTAPYGGGSWSSADTNAVILGSSGTSAWVEALTEPRDTIIYMLTSSCGTFTDRHILLIDVYLPETPISGDSVLCVGDSISLTADPLSGVWSSSHTGAAIIDGDGEVYGLAFGTTVISYSAANTCETRVLTKTLTVYPTSTFGGLDSARLCVGSSQTLSVPVGGGSWSSTGSGISLTTSGDSAVVTGLYPGTDTVFYSISGLCGTTVYKHIINVSGPVSAGSITGAAGICMGTPDTLIDVVAGGVWSVDSPSIATVTGSGIVSGVSPGTALITYSLYSCDTNMAIFAVTVYPAPASSLVDSFTLCSGYSVTIMNPFPGGSWTTAFGTASVTVSGDSAQVSAAGSGPDTVFYSLEGECGIIIDKYLFHFLPAADAGVISGSLALCPGSIGFLTSSVSGGVWWLGYGSSISFLSGGIINALSAGTTDIYYSVSNACGYATASATVTVYPLSGLSIDSTTLCEGSVTYLWVAEAGGSWTITNANAEFTTTGSGYREVSGISPGRDTAIYNLSTFCGTDQAIHILKIPADLALPPLTGDSVLCRGGNITLGESISGGYWRSSNTSVAEVSGGVVGGIAPGVVSIYYYYTGCTTSVAEKTITIVAPVGYVTVDPLAICIGASATLNPISSGGVWSVTNNRLTSATIGGRILITGAVAGTDTAVYTITSECLYYDQIVHVLPDSYMSPIIGSAILCAGFSETMADTSRGGTWTSSSVSLATIDSSGLLTAIAAGVDTVCYTGIGGCGAAALACKTVTIGVLTLVSITGPDSLCRGSSATLMASLGGGIWISGDTGIATVTGGVAHAFSAGTVSIVYSRMEDCGMASADTFLITVDTLPVLAITGPDTLCAGSAGTFSAASGGVWSLTDSLASGTILSPTDYGVTAVATGEDSIVCTFENACGTRVATKHLVISSLPSGGSIIGTDSLCPGQTSSFSETVPGGTWSLAGSNASVTPGGLVSYISTGIDTLKYRVSGYCGAGIANFVVNCLPPESIAPIRGLTTFCAGTVTTLSDSTAGGEWLLTNPLALLVPMGASARLNGLTAGSDTVYYISHQFCGADTALAALTILPYPAATPILGTDSICIGESATFTDSSSGGMWSISGSASISGGIVHATLPGTDTVSYTYTNSCHSDVEVRKQISVSGRPPVGIITGPTSICVGSHATFADSVAGGVWSVLGTGGAISTTGVFSAALAGSSEVLYTSSNFCGNDTTMNIITIDSVAPVTFTGRTFVCIGGSDTFEITPTGGSLTATNGKAHISSWNVAVGIETGIDTLVYTYTNSCGSMSGRFALNIFTDWGCDSINLVHAVNQNGGIDIFPNPGTGRYEVKLPVMAGDIRAIIKDMPGQTVFEAVYQNTDRIIADITGRSDGTYLIQIVADGAVYYGKLVLW